VNGTKDNRLSRIYREGAWPEPSRQIDAAILSASRRAAREEHSFAKRWAPAFAIAATVMLTSALVLKVYRAQPEVVSLPASENEPESRVTRAPPAVEPKAAETNTVPAPAPQAAATPKGFASTMDAAEAERLDRLQRDLGSKQGLPPSGSLLSAPKPAPAEKAAPALKKEASQPLQRRPDLPQSQSAHPREATSPPREQRPMSVFGASSPAPAPSPAAPSTASAPALAPASPPAPTPAFAPAAAPAAAATSGAVTSALSAAPKAPERSPQVWIEEIRKLMAAGQSEEAGAEIAEFKKRYPDYTLPEDLR
jgi:hypothetical protein